MHVNYVPKLDIMNQNLVEDDIFPNPDIVIKYEVDSSNGDGSVFQYSSSNPEVTDHLPLTREVFQPGTNYRLHARKVRY